MNNLLHSLNKLELTLEDRKDFFLTTSFGYQSSVMFFLFDLISVKPDVLYIDNGLIEGNVSEHRKKLEKKFKFNLEYIDRREYVESFLGGRDIRSLNAEDKKIICRDSKRDPLKSYIQRNKKNIWISGIRRDQTSNRSELNFVGNSDLDVVKLSPLANFNTQEIKEIATRYSLPLNLNYKDLCKENPSNECGLHI